MKNKKLIMALTTILATATIFTACGESEDKSDATTASSVNDSVSETTRAEESETTANEQTGEEVTATIQLNETSVECDNENVEIDGTTVKIVNAGTYTITGNLEDGQIIVDAGKENQVDLILDNASVASSVSAPLCILSADKTVITLADGTTNNFTDADSYAADDEANACVFSKDDLTIKGNGTLNVTGNFNNGIGSKNDLKIKSGNYNIIAENDALKGNDSVTIEDGVFCITAGGDGIKSDNETEAEKGFVTIETGVFTVTAGDDVVQAFSALTINGGTYVVTQGGEKAKCDGTVNIADGTL